jgi:hypothetical protein
VQIRHSKILKYKVAHNKIQVHIENSEMIPLFCNLKIRFVVSCCLVESQKKIDRFSVFDGDIDEWLVLLPDGQKYKCLMCAKEITRKDNAKSHFRRLHCIQEKPAVCHICGKHYKGKINRNEHLRVVHGITQAMMRRNLGPSSPNWSHT